MGFFDKIKQGLTKTKTKMDAQLTGIFAAYEPGDEEFFEDLEETLILADTGVETTTKAIAQLRKAIELKKLRTGAEVKKEFVQILTRILKVQDTMLLLTTQPSVVLVVGVNGVGKTTTIGKLAAQLKKEGNRVLLSAADTFRAAAADQLTVWAQRAGVDIVKHEEGSDPAAVVFDSIQAAKARGTDVVIIDTAGRLHNKTVGLVRSCSYSSVICLYTLRSMYGGRRQSYLLPVVAVRCLTDIWPWREPHHP